MDAANREPLAPSDPYIAAIAADHAIADASLPVFDLDDTNAIADFIAAIVGLVVSE
jgi:molybdopterin-guanine dinucleotide biosynthesis protein B